MNQWSGLSNPDPWPDMASRKPDNTRIDAKLQLSSAEFPPHYEDHFCSRHTGYLKIDTAGDYTHDPSSHRHSCCGFSIKAIHVIRLARANGIPNRVTMVTFVMAFEVGCRQSQACPS